VDATVENYALSIRFDALLKEAGPSRLDDFHYIPVVFHEAERPHRQQLPSAPSGTSSAGITTVESRRRRRPINHDHLPAKLWSAPQRPDEEIHVKVADNGDSRR
jgi:hypothetical protein